MFENDKRHRNAIENLCAGYLLYRRLLPGACCNASMSLLFRFAIAASLLLFIETGHAGLVMQMKPFIEGLCMQSVCYWIELELVLGEPHAATRCCADTPLERAEKLANF